MGNPSSKFRKYIQNGDEFAAMQVYQSSHDVRKCFDPNLSYGENQNHNTALHYAAKHGMKHLLRTFLNDSGGNPNKRNGSNETVLHSCCAIGQHKSYSAHERKSTCVSIVLQWRGAILESGEKEKIEIDTKDSDGNSALHHAANNGLTRCAQLLIGAGADIFLENNAHMTPCDLATSQRHHNLARILEAKMLFTETPSDSINEDDILSNGSDGLYSGLKPEDLREVKDELLLDTSDMLNVSLPTAQALLRENDWSREALLDKWFQNPDLNMDVYTCIEIDYTCRICYNTESNGYHLKCGHIFCGSCWENYLYNQINIGNMIISCPEVDCNMVVSADIFELSGIQDIFEQFNLDDFIYKRSDLKWCPVSGCGKVVQNFGQNKCVDCGSGHYFCFNCTSDAHNPASCSQMSYWHDKLSKIKPEECHIYQKTTEIANSLWIVNNSKPCPNCGSHIQKGDGCNHIKCTKCKYDFCWICTESWKKHNSSTGGYFRCNRSEAVLKAEEKQAQVVSQAISNSRENSELSRFLSYYAKFRKHSLSRKMEEPLLTNIKEKIQILTANKDRGCEFLEEGVRELIKARYTLCGCYVYAYYTENPYNFELKTNELEENTDKLSNILSKPYIKTPKSIIISTTSLVRKKRLELSRNTHEIEKEKPELQATSYLPITGDDSVELAIALEMSRLQMIEEEMIRFNSRPDLGFTEHVDPELNLAIERSLEDSFKNSTVRQFMKSLENKTLEIDDKNEIWIKSNRELNIKEDGRFQIGDVHQNGLYIDTEPKYLRRSHSTGELGKMGKSSEPRYHLDSDHSSQHDDRPEEMRRVIKQSPEQSSLDEPSESQPKKLSLIGKRPALDGCLTLSRDKISSFSLSSESSSVEGHKLEPIRESSDSGIPKSPNLYISGVSICRTPESRSPGGKGRSSSLTDENEDVFKFNKSTTEGALSSVLHVQERNLSSDDFHEALFLKKDKNNENNKSKKKRERAKDGPSQEASSII